MTDDHRGAQRAFEMHVQTLLTTGILALCAWTLLTTHNLSIQVEGLRQRMVILDRQMITVTAGISDRYTTHDAAADRVEILRETTRIETRVDALTERLREIERAGMKSKTRGD